MLEYIMILRVKNDTILVCVHADNEMEAYRKIGEWGIERRIFADNIQCVEVKGTIEEVA